MTQLLIGSHLSTSGGWNKLIERSHNEGGTTFAFFPRSPYGKKSTSLTTDGATDFARRLVAEHYGPLVAHAPYVYNLAAKDQAKREFAIHALAEDLELLAPIRHAGQEIYLNIHPGSHVGQGAAEGCRLIADGLNHVYDLLSEDGDTDDSVPILLETMAGKGTECGRDFDQLATIIGHVDPDHTAHLGVTLDTCHVYDAGYDLLNDFDGVLRRLDDAIGLNRVKAIHANDSQYGLDSHKDRHANIGDGQLGTTFFTQLVNDPRMASLPMILETKEQTATTHRDEIALLRGLRNA
ncbi:MULTISPECIES: deoxyribonuclease IV [Bifidobacterium]|uniref:deoxyribonuclease IV n=1 Tax=Bifidobacterium TaxID=1678 RepID=UPI001BDCC29D|nr:MULTISPECIES: deoxyribonuclease IV [Bifidobacterium]MBT1162719.1 deoxyribonuclease IV [Bifidobacterium sp. SO1]MBW3078695.1 deoxyribonuclease IV [Bifidobacterium simiiventris]